MNNLDLSIYGITGATEIIHNPSYEELFVAETDPTLEGYEKGQETELGAVNVMTGIYTGRSPKDKFIVMDENSKDTVWWTSDEFKNDNHPCSKEAWAQFKDIAVKELSGKKLYVQDVFCGTNKELLISIGSTPKISVDKECSLSPLSAIGDDTSIANPASTPIQ